MSEGLAQGPYVAAVVGFKPASFSVQGTDFTTEPPRPAIRYVNVELHYIAEVMQQGVFLMHP